MEKFIPLYKCRHCDIKFQGESVENKKHAQLLTEHTGCRKMAIGCADLVAFIPFVVTKETEDLEGNQLELF